MPFLQRRPKDPKSVYIMRAECPRCGFAPVKPGEGDTESRLKDGRTWVPWLELVTDVLLPGKDVSRAVEAEMHAAFAGRHLGGEWYDVSAQEAVAQLERIVHWSGLRVRVHLWVRGLIARIGGFFRVLFQVVIAGLAMIGLAAVLSLEAPGGGDPVPMPGLPWQSEQVVAP